MIDNATAGGEDLDLVEIARPWRILADNVRTIHAAQEKGYGSAAYLRRSSISWTPPLLLTKGLQSSGRPADARAGQAAAIPCSYESLPHIIKRSRSATHPQEGDAVFADRQMIPFFKQDSR
jgi:hypothetical protein